MKASRLSLLLLRRSPTRAVMLIILIAVAIVVFALITELSRVSKEGVDEAITQDSGQRGAYTIMFSPELGLPVAQQQDMVRQAAEKLNMALWGYWEDMPPIASECVPVEKAVTKSLRVLWKQPGVPFDLPFGQVAGIETQRCIGGQSIPAEVIFAPERSQQGVFGASLYIRSDYQNLSALNTLGPIQRGFTLLSGRDEPMEAALTAELTESARPFAAQSGMQLDGNLQVFRTDKHGQQTRKAADGLSITYAVIGWGTIVLAGLAVVVIQTSHLRQRLWFYGLLQSLGATTRRLAGILLVDGIVVLVAGSALSGLVLWLGQPTVYEFARSAFGVHANVLSVHLLPNLLIGLTTILAMATVIPLLAALRRDPLDVLEAPRD